MDYLLDTHVCIWTIGREKKLSATVTDILRNPEINFWVSKLSIWEIAIKLKIGKLPDFKTPLPEFIRSVYISGYKMLSVKDEHLETYHVLDFNESHRDPFDRYLLAAARFENFAIITKDEKSRLYANDFKIVG